MRYLVLIFLLIAKVQAQSFPRPEIDLDAFILKTAPIQNEDLNYEDLYENLYTLYQKPLDLNRATVNDLRAFFFLTELQINALIDHKQKFGPFLSIYELQSVENFTLEEAKALIPFVVVNPLVYDATFKNLRNRITEHYLVVRADQVLEPSRGFLEGKYLGSRQRYYTRYRLAHSKDFSVGFVTEKDPGERDFFDYVVFHAQIQNKGAIKNLIIGDFLMQFGQGLIFSAGFAPGKGSEPVFSTRRSNVGIRPFNSVLENASFRGSAVTVKKGKFEYTAMASYNRRDASTTEIPETEEAFFSSIQTSGFHRTQTEIANKNAIVESNLGGNLLYNVGPIQLGFSALATNFDKTFQKRNLLYNNFEFSGKQNFIMGPNFSISWQNFNFFGEGARSSSGGYGFISGLVASLNAKTEWAINVRNYQPNFHTFYGQGFSEGSRTINEKGIYTGLKYTIKKGLFISGFYDNFRFPWLRFRVDAPSKGYDYQVKLGFQPNKLFQQYIIFHQEVKERNGTENILNSRQLAETNRRNLVLGTEYIWNKILKFQNKLQYNGFAISDKGLSNGFAVIQDVEAKIGKFQIKTRAAYFNTQDFESRIYAYENDVLYAVSFPAYFGKGMRYYAVLRYDINRNLALWCRWSQTNVNDRPFIGSANDQLPSNVRNDIKLQIKYSFR